MSKAKTVFVQNWIERERGWGQRPDGFTVHISRTQRDAYVHWYNKTFNNSKTVPDEYTKEDGEPIEVEVDAKLYAAIKKASLKKIKDGRVLNGIHGNGRSFSMTPLRMLKKEDVIL